MTTKRQLEEECIVLRDYTSSSDLKKEINSRIRVRKASQWRFVELSSRGACLYLMFEQPNSRF